MSILLISLLNDDESDLINRLYNEYKRPMFDAAYDILQDDGLSEDAIHTAFLNVSCHLNKLRDVKSTRTKAYLLTVVKNAAKKMYNKRKPILYVDELTDRDLPSADRFQPEEQLSVKLSRERMAECLCKMKPKYRDVLIMKYYMEHDDSFIAAALGLTQAAVRKRLERARKDFLLRYGGEYGEK